MTTSDDRDAHEPFLQEIIAAPDDDLPRLIYADWLEERGDQDQATFIRQALAAARLAPEDPARARLEAQCKELRQAHGRRWRDELGVGLDDWQVGYLRGLVEKVELEQATEFWERAETLFRWLPLRHLVFGGFADPTDGDVTLGRLAAFPPLARLRTLLLVEIPFHAEALTAFVVSPLVANLRRLGFVNCTLLPEDVAILASAPNLAGLEELDLSGNAVGVDGAQAILDSPFLTRLRHLYLDEVFFGEEEGEEEVGRELEEQFGEGLHWHESMPF
jgi:uncharacterized protein (TIGR02996 family)